MTGSKLFVSDAEGKVAAAPRNESVVFETQPQFAQSCFQAGGGFIVTNQRVCDSQRVPVQGAIQRNTVLPETGSSQILNGSQEAGRANKHLHAGKASNSAREI